MWRHYFVVLAVGALAALKESSISHCFFFDMKKKPASRYEIDQNKKLGYISFSFSFRALSNQEASGSNAATQKRHAND